MVKVTALRLPLLAISSAISLMVVRRTISLSKLLNDPEMSSSSLSAEFVALLISVLLFVGILRIAPLLVSIVDSNAKLKEAREKLSKDVEKRKKVEQNLKKVSAEVLSLYEDTPVMMHSSNSKGEVVTVSNKWLAATGYSREEVVGRKSTEFLTEESRANALAHGFSKLFEDGFLVDFELHFVKKNGDILEVLLSAVAKKDEHGALGCTQAVLIDVTETRRLQALESRALRLETAGKISGQIAHDFNNLLAPLMTYPDFIREELSADHPALEFLDDIEESTKRIADINQQLLTLGRRGYYKPVLFNLNDIVLSVVKEQKLFGGAVSYSTTLADELMCISGGSSQVYRVLANLLTNARDAIEGEGQISIKSENNYVDISAINFGRIPVGEYVKLTISDTGCGISPDIIQKIFDPFFTTKQTDKQRGSGLGLSVVDSVMKDHGGHLDIRSSVGSGTTFYLYFPSAPEVVLSGDDVCKAGAATETVMVIDDDEMQRKVTSRMLEKIGYRVNVAVSGEQAIAILKESPHDLLILDMIMPPGMDGAETYKKVLESYPRQKAIIVSGYAETKRIQMAQRMGAGDFYYKPLTQKILAKAVRDELGKVRVPVGHQG